MKREAERSKEETGERWGLGGGGGENVKNQGGKC